MPRTIFSYLIILFLLIAGLSNVVSAQGGQLSDGAIETGTLNPGSPVVYTFTGNANDLVTVYVISGAELQPTLNIVSSSGQVGFSNNDALTPMSNDARISAKLSATDTYIVTLSSLSSTAGSFTLWFSVAQPLASTTLADQATVAIPPNGTAQQFTIPANPDSSRQLRIQGLDSSARFSAHLYANDGTILAALPGGLTTVILELPASAEPYTLTIEAVDSAIGTSVQVDISSDGTTATTTSTSTQPEATQSSPTSTDENACVITASGVNVRSGPGTGFGIIGSLNEGNQIIATGQNNGWYNGSFNGSSAWVAANVVNPSGNCSSLPVVQAPSAPAPAATEEVTSNQQQQSATQVPTTTQQNQPTQAPPTTAPPTEVPTTEVAFNVVSVSCRWFQNDGATVDFNVTGPARATFRIDVRQGSTTYSNDRTLNDQGFLRGNQRFGQAGNTNYTAYIVYNGVDLASAEC